MVKKPSKAKKSEAKSKVKTKIELVSKLKPESNSPHKSFKRSFREDYQRDLNVPGMAEHIFRSFEIIFKNWRLFLPLTVIAAVLSVLLVGTNLVLNETTWVFGILIFLMLWLVVIYILRKLLDQKQVSLKEAFFNAMTPLISTLVVFVVIVIQCVPIFLLIIAYSAAVKTEFLSTPFYALLFLGFAFLMITISGYLLSSSVIVLIAVTAPGLYPLAAFRAVSDLMMGRRMRFLLRLIALILVLAVIWMIVMIPVLALKLPAIVVAIAVTILTCISAVYLTVYLYLYYKWLLKA